MYFDPARSAYIDKESGNVIFVEESGSVDTSAVTVSVATPQSSIRSSKPLSPAKSSKLNSFDASLYSGTIAVPTSEFKSADGGDDIEKAKEFERLFEDAVLESQEKGKVEQLQQDLFDLHISDGYDVVPGPSGVNPMGGGVWEDWYFARTLQALEFEIDETVMDRYHDASLEHADFERKEYHASRSCRRQLLTISCFICLIQIAILIAMVQIAGYAPQAENPVIGPPVYIMVRFGAKEAALIVDRGQWWRLLSPIFVHAGIFHIIPNVAIQLRVGGYLNLIWGTPKWLWIYLISGIYGSILSCLCLPADVGVGSSGSLMGMLSAWVVWILFRWQKIPPQCHGQRNCQLVVVVVSIVVTIATSWTPNVDWAAHMGGTMMGILWGIILLGNEIDNTWHQRYLRVFAIAAVIVTLVYSIWYMIYRLQPDTSSLSYWAQNDEW